MTYTQYMAQNLKTPFTNINTVTKLMSIFLFLIVVKTLSVEHFRLEKVYTLNKFTIDVWIVGALIYIIV